MCTYTKVSSKTKQSKRNGHLTPVAGSIFGPLSQTHISKRVFINGISNSDLLDIQLTLFCVCGVDSFLPELEHL